jgi:hypothetical protein
MKATPKRNVLRINTSTADDQQNPSIAIDERGNFVIVWQSESEEDGEEIFARFFLPGGTPFAPEILVNSFREGDQSRPAVGIDSIGNAVTVWQAEDQGDAGSGIFAQRYQFAGNDFLQSGSEFRVNTTTEGQQQNPDVAFEPLGAGQENEGIREARNYVVVWQGEGTTTNNVIGRDESGFGIFAQRYNRAGTPQGRAFLVNTTTERDQINPAVAVDAKGNFVVVWQSRSGRNGTDIFGQRYDSAGNPVGIQFQVNTFVSGDQINPDVTIDAEGNFVVVWQDEEQDGDGSGIYARRYSARGNPIGAGNFRVNSTTDGNQETPSIGSDRNGNFTIVWASDSGDNYNIVGQQFAANGRQIDGEFEVSRSSNRDQTRPQIAVRSNGNFVVAWQSDEGGDRGTDILARRFTVPQTGGNNSGNGGGNGNGNGNGGSPTDPIRPPRSRLARAASKSDMPDLDVPDLIVGTPGDDLISGKGNQRMRGKGGSDRFVIGKGLGKKTILDFQPGQDQLVLKGNLQLEDLTFSQRGSNTVVEANDYPIGGTASHRILAVLRGVNFTSEMLGI